MIKVFAKDIEDKKVFKRAGYDYYQVYADRDNHIYIYEMELDGIHKGYEVIKAIRHKNPDGRIIYKYPNDEQFGLYGWYISGPLRVEMEKIPEKVLTLKKRGNG